MVQPKNNQAMRNGPSRRPFVPRSFKLILSWAVLLFALFVPSRAHAYTWMIRHAYTGCGICHGDPSGGEVLTAYGRAQSQLLLSMNYGKVDESGEPSKATGFLGFIDLPEPVLLGGSARVASTVKDGEFDFFPMQLDMYGQFRIGTFFAGGSVGAARVEPGSPHAHAAQVTTNQGNEFNLISRNHYLGLDLGEGAFTLRAGRLNLPFGIRIPEHTMWVRDVTRTDRESDQQHGVSLAYNSEVGRGEIMAIAGNYQINPDEYRERGYSFYAEFMAGERTALGISSLYTYAKTDRLSIEHNVARGVHGGYLRSAIGDPFALLAEFDLMTNSTTSLGYVGFLQGDYEIVQGLHALATFELVDRGLPKGLEADQKGPGVGQPQVGAWLSGAWFMATHLDLRVDAFYRQDEGFTLLSQFHAYL
jgi:hypothetical protein